MMNDSHALGYIRIYYDKLTKPEKRVRKVTIIMTIALLMETYNLHFFSFRATYGSTAT